MTQIDPARKNIAMDIRIRRQKQDCMDVFIQILTVKANKLF
ncbi:MAG: hypothetical protein V7L31_17080 [Nostoc sp.]